MEFIGGATVGALITGILMLIITLGDHDHMLKTIDEASIAYGTPSIAYCVRLKTNNVTEIGVIAEEELTRFAKCVEGK